jgi:hypothetical protein
MLKYLTNALERKSEKEGRKEGRKKGRKEGRKRDGEIERKEIGGRGGINGRRKKRARGL